MNEQEKLLLFLEHILTECDGEQIDPTEYSKDYQELATALNHTSEYISQAYTFALDIANGNLEGDAPSRSNMLAGPFRALRSSLMHLTWQSQRVAAGDYNQRVDFLGEFSQAFNQMITQLELREMQLKKAARQASLRASDLYKNNELLLSITELVADWIIVIDSDTCNVNFVNNAAKYGIKDYELDFSSLCLRLSQNRREPQCQKWNLFIENPKLPHELLEFSVSTYPLHGRTSESTLYILRDTTQQQRKMREMEVLVYRDVLTKLYNRRYCLQLLDELLRQHEPFSLCFMDLNNLKYINDHFGHDAGDRYITIVAETVKNVLRSDDVVCRFGGDELVAILHDCSIVHATHRMEETQNLIIEQGKANGWDISISYGIIPIHGDEEIASHELIHAADQKMYEFKLEYKMNKKSCG